MEKDLGMEALTNMRLVRTVFAGNLQAHLGALSRRPDYRAKRPPHAEGWPLAFELLLEFGGRFGHCLNILLRLHPRHQTDHLGHEPLLRPVWP